MMRAKNLKQRPALLYAVLGIGAMVLGVQYMAHTPMALMTYDGLPADDRGQVFVQAEDVDVKVFVHVNSGSGS